MAGRTHDLRQDRRGCGRAANYRHPGPGGVDGLRACGLSRARASSLLDLAARQDSGLIDVTGMRGLPDDEVTAALTSVRGVGAWTAQMFLIHQLHRPDVLPAGDLGIRHGVQVAWHLTVMPSVRQVQERGAVWAPHRTYAAALLWRSLQPPVNGPDMPPS